MLYQPQKFFKLRHSTQTGNGGLLFWRSYSFFFHIIKQQQKPLERSPAFQYIHFKPAPSALAFLPLVHCRSLYKRHLKFHSQVWISLSRATAATTLYMKSFPFNAFRFPVYSGKMSHFLTMPPCSHSLGRTQKSFWLSLLYEWPSLFMMMSEMMRGKCGLLLQQRINLPFYKMSLQPQYQADILLRGVSSDTPHWEQKQTRYEGRQITYNFH